MGSEALEKLDYTAYFEDNGKKQEIRKRITELEKNERLSLSNQLQSQLQAHQAEY